MRTHDSSLVSFSGKGDELRVRDELEDQDLTLTLDGPVTPEPGLTDLFHFPVDRAVSCVTTSLRVGEAGSVFLQDRNGERISDFSEETSSFPRDTYYLDVGGQVKTYVRIADAAVEATFEEHDRRPPIRLTFDEETTVTVGARSLHSRPAATITVPDDPEAMMEAFSYLGSSIKEFSPERSWPTLRGHPPRFERGDELRVPDHLSKPDTGFTVTVPPTYADLYRVAPLAFYLGATVEPGEPALHFPNGYVERLATQGRSLETAVDWLLARCLVLDALVRDAGYNPVPLQEYEDLSPHLPFYPRSLYDEPLATQVMEYLEVSEQPLRDVVPRWQTTAVLRPDPADVTLVPSLLADLARIHVADAPLTTVRDASVDAPSPTCVAGVTHADVPVGGTRLLESAFDHARVREVPTLASARLAVVTETAAAADQVRDRIDRGDDRLDPDRIAVHAAPTRAELAALLSGDADLVHVGLPTDAEGIVCVDGPLDPATLAGVEVPFLTLAGEPGMATAAELVDQGAVAALVTPAPLSPVEVVRFLRGPLAGHSLADTASFLFDETPYRFVGDPTQEVAHRDGGVPGLLYHLRSVSVDEHDLFVQTCPNTLVSAGGVVSITEAFAREDYSLIGSYRRQPMPVDTETVVEMLEDDELLATLNGEAHHGETEPTAEFVRESAREELPSANRRLIDRSDSP